jgi:hypothetical protein
MYSFDDLGLEGSGGEGDGFILPDPFLLEALTRGFEDDDDVPLVVAADVVNGEGKLIRFQL